MRREIIMHSHNLDNPLSLVGAGSPSLPERPVSLSVPERRQGVEHHRDPQGRPGPGKSLLRA